ncbi:MAG: hypothetical protein IJ125_01140 [Atopobiaceae bacterium]|nr:hypothetical protein [Atopobiaceae bacterium]
MSRQALSSAEQRARDAQGDPFSPWYRGYDSFWGYTDWEEDSEEDEDDENWT